MADMNTYKRMAAASKNPKPVCPACGSTHVSRFGAASDPETEQPAGKKTRKPLISYQCDKCGYLW